MFNLLYLRTYLLTHLYLLYGQVELELEMLCETSDAFLDLVAGRPTNPMADRLAPVQPRTPVGALTTPLIITRPQPLASQR